jgi:uncharacterized membrane protein SirB2
VLEYYAEIRFVHFVAALASGSLFLSRGLLVQAGRPGWALAPLPRNASYAIDTVLLAAALVLVSILPSAVFANGWLAAKLALLPLYIGLGWGALRAGTRARRLACFAAAILAFAGMYTIARAHSPYGPLAPLLAA